MSPVTHFFAGWLLASSARLRRREKALVVAAGLAPDLDGIGIIPEVLTRHSSHPLFWFSEYHHSLHTLAFALAVTLAVWAVSAHPYSAVGLCAEDRHLQSRPLITITTMLAFLSFHLHLLCDLVGSRGPDGYNWPIPYLKPFSDSLQLSWHGQWALNGWQNIVITLILLLITLWIAVSYGSSPVELISEKGNTRLVAVLRARINPGT
jgi:inner membrane protein